VLSIDFAHEHVSVTTNSDTYRAKHVVIAVPPATALSNIVFTPDLPKELVNVAARTPVWMGAVTKVIALYESPFWREQGLSGSAMSHVGPLREIHDISDHNASFGALFGFSRERVSEISVKSQLAALFGPRAGMPKSILLEDWSESPLTSPPGVFQLNDYQLFGSRVLRQDHCEGMLYFASTETSTDSPGHVQGAFAAARATAAKVVASLR
jgi:monoamine oxidase